jgi:hypothetical protein
MGKEDVKLSEAFAMLICGVGCGALRFWFIFLLYTEILVKDFGMPIIGFWHIAWMFCVFHTLFGTNVKRDKEGWEAIFLGYFTTGILFIMYWCY